jgi:hypothetical protein
MVAFVPPPLIARQSSAMLIAARSSQDFACIWHATVSARSKYIRLLWIRRERFECDFPGNAIDLGLAPPLVRTLHFV